MSIPRTLFVSNQDNPYSKCESCHGGKGSFFMKDVISKVSQKQFIKYFHDDVITPGATFGNHAHRGNKLFEEWYFCLSGEGIMILDDEKYEMKPGDISVCYNNGSHGIENTGGKDMHILVIGVSAVSGS